MGIADDSAADRLKKTYYFKTTRFQREVNFPEFLETVTEIKEKKSAFPTLNKYSWQYEMCLSWAAF